MSARAGLPGPSQRLQRLGAGVGQAGRYLGQSLRLMVGLPSYDAYLAHWAARHPGQQPPSYEQFFRERQQARYGGGAGRCC